MIRSVLIQHYSTKKARLTQLEKVTMENPVFSEYLDVSVKHVRFHYILTGSSFLFFAVLLCGKAFADQEVGGPLIH